MGFVKAKQFKKCEIPEVPFNNKANCLCNHSVRDYGRDSLLSGLVFLIGIGHALILSREPERSLYHPGQYVCEGPDLGEVAREHCAAWLVEFHVLQDNTT